MKLSKKGFHKVLRTCRFDEDRATYVLKHSEAIKDYFFEAQGIEFEQNDFVGMVCLTVDEAKEIIGTYIGTNCEIVKQHGIPELKIKNPSWLIHLLERIEQVEGNRVVVEIMEDCDVRPL